ncbi:MAG: MFS transporter [Candidatus Melainabacteria bacterium]|jgi:MFS family permease|nr:MFS transporter [Candidatus Melainabacteria bacterium]
MAKGSVLELPTAAPEENTVMQTIEIQEDQHKGDGPKPWHVLLATWLGGVFDGFDSSIFAMVLFPAVSELIGSKDTASVGQFGSYIIALFLVGWAIGAAFFGWLADRIGRAKTLTLTILVYALCTGLCATAHTWWEMGLYRFLVGAGIGGEMGIGAVLLTECWPKKSRLHAVGFMATSLGFGYLLTASLNLMLGGFGWRWLFVAGIAPAFLTLYIRSKLKEPENFTRMQSAREEAKNTNHEHRTEEQHELMKSSFATLISPENIRKTCIVAMLTSCAIIAWWAVLSWIPSWINQITGDLAVEQRSHVMFFKDIGMILSGILGGFIITKLGYRKCMGWTFTLAFFATVAMFMSFKAFTPLIFPFILAVGFFAHVPFVLLWGYIPELYETRIRGTAFGITYNVGRLVAAAAAVLSGELIKVFGGSYATAASTVACVFLLGTIVSFFMPKPCGKMIDR